MCCPIVLVCLLVLCSRYGQSSGEEPLWIIAGSQVSVPLISRPVICYRKGGTTPPKLWSLAGVLFGIVIVAETSPPLFLFFVLFFGHVLLWGFILFIHTVREQECLAAAIICSCYICTCLRVGTYNIVAATLAI